MSGGLDSTALGMLSKVYSLIINLFSSNVETIIASQLSMDAYKAILGKAYYYAVVD